MNRPTIVTLLKGPAARTAFRRALPRGRVHVVSCRSAAALGRLLATTLADAVVVDPRVPGALGALGACRVTYPGIPRFAYSAFRPTGPPLGNSCILVCLAFSIFFSPRLPLIYPGGCLIYLTQRGSHE